MRGLTQCCRFYGEGRSVLTYVAWRDFKKLRNYQSNSDAEIEQHTLKGICIWVCVCSSWRTSVPRLRLSTAYQRRIWATLLRCTGKVWCQDLRRVVGSSLSSWGSDWSVTVMRNCRFESTSPTGLRIVPESICGQWRFRSWLLSFVEVAQWASSNASCHCQINWLRSVRQSLGWIKGGE